MDSQITQNHYQIKKNVPELNPGDRIRVHQKIKEGNKERIQVFEGLVIKTQHGRGINGTFTVRRISLGVGVEKTLPLHLPTIVKIEKIRSAKVRRAKLYYVRDLIGKRARRLKKEKEDAAVWEDVVIEEKPSDEASQEVAEEKNESEAENTDEPQAKEKEEVTEEKKENKEIESKDEKAEESPKNAKEKEEN